MLHEFVERGWIAVVCNYRLAPRHPWPAQMQDVTRTLAWLKKNIANHGEIRPNRVSREARPCDTVASLLALSGERSHLADRTTLKHHLTGRCAGACRF